MRISYWSSVVGSSDLAVIAMSAEPTLDGIIRHDVAEPPKVMIRTRKKTIVPRSATQVTYMEALTRNDIIFALGPAGTGKTYLAVAQAVSQLITGRSEEHTSELQSLMRISYAVFCLKKKKKHRKQT